MALGIIVVMFTTVFIVSVYGYVKPLPKGLSYEGDVHLVDEVEFLYDLTYEQEGAQHKEQQIFEYLYEMIDEAEEFIVLDMFLFNDEYDRDMSFPTLSQTLTNHLVEKKQSEPKVNILFITDPINTFYGAYSSKMVNQLEEQGIEVISTDMTQTRDSNPIYSGAWRTYVQWFGTAGNGWLPNAFSPDSPNVTLRSYLKLLNFKANHRKVMITENEGLVTSANPHDGSAVHSNIAFAFSGSILEELLASEIAVARMSDSYPDWVNDVAIKPSNPSGERYKLQLLTEGKIKKHLIEELRFTEAGDRVTMGAFYLSDRDVISELIVAADRGVEVRLILDANKDAFGREKSGIPNRPVAHELIKKTNEALQVRWYNTSGEQYHTKMIILEQQEKDVIIAGSSNFTKRNLADFNLETDVKISTLPNDGVGAEVRSYFDTLWNDGTYTLDYEEFADDSLVNRLLYRFQEWTGLSTF